MITDSAARPPEQLRLIGGGKISAGRELQAGEACKALLCQDIKIWINGMHSAYRVSYHRGLNHIFIKKYFP